jgi:hypothetical protein
LAFEYLMKVFPEKHTWWGSFQKSIHDEGHSRKAYMMRDTGRMIHSGLIVLQPRYRPKY